MSDVARQLQMLKAVVEDEPFDAALREFTSARKAIRADAEKNAVAQRASTATALHRSCEPLR